jgi:divalent metal cation (Fe/Co/Zn/Cd) transporter
VLNCITLQQGPGEVFVSIKISFQSGLDIDEVCRIINRFEEKLRGRVPEARWIFVEPDIDRAKRDPSDPPPLE